MARSHEIALIIEGPGVKPGSMDPFLALDLARAYLDLLRRVSEESGDALDLTGLEVQRGSFKLKTYTREREAAIRSVRRVASYVSQASPSPAHLEGKVNRVREALLRVSPHWATRTQVDDDVVEPLLTVARETETGATETLEVRALVIGAWGQKRPFAEFVSRSEDRPFTLTVTKEDAKALGAHLFEEVDLTATVTRDDRDIIRGGSLDEFTPVETVDALAAWREWFKTAGMGWESMIDIEEELGRD